MTGFLHVAIFALAIWTSIAFAGKIDKDADHKCYHEIVDHATVRIINATHGNITCLKGYTRVVSNAIVRCDSTEQGYRWTIQGSLRCLAVRCPERVEHGDIIGASGRDFGQRRTIRCQAGYRAAGDEGSIICVASKDDITKGVWHGLHCTPQVCTRHMIPHGQVLTTTTPLYQSTGIVQCHDGYSGRSGANGTVTCALKPNQQGVRWKGYRCKPTNGRNCTHVPFYHGEVRTKNGRRGRVTCLPGFTAQRATGRVRCSNQNGVLSWTGFTCARVQCPTGIRNGRITNTTDALRLGSIATVQCHDGYTGSGTSGTAACIAGSGPSVGVWHGMECKRVVCDNPMTAGETTKLVGKYKDRATVQCNIGRDVGDEAPRALCTSNGRTVEGAWNYTGPSCLDLVRCELRVSSYQYFYPALNNHFQVTLKLNQYVTVHCVPGWQLSTEYNELNVTCTNMSVVKPAVPECQDIDECAAGLHNCHEHATCHNVLGSYRCICNTGYSGDGRNCTEITCPVDDLRHGTTIPDKSTVKMSETVGYHCDKGFYLVGNSSRTCIEDGLLHPRSNPTCHNADECLNETACHKEAYCNDTHGSFQCTCRDGFRGDGFISCIDINECLEGLHNCPANSYCVNEPGSFYCKCRSGYKQQHNETSPAGFYCVDIDECASYIDNCTEAMGSNCTNTPGAFECPCSTGYNGTGFNECDPVSCNPPEVQGLMILPEKPVYMDKVEYSCEQGFRHSGEKTTQCQADGELISSAANCDEIKCDSPELVNGDRMPNDTVVYFDETVTYNCDSGYTLVGPETRTCGHLDELEPDLFPECQNINECANETLHRCSQYAYCTDRNGSHDCTCHAGYTGDGYICDNIDECAEDLHNCTNVEVCEDTEGAFKCNCKEGYTRNSTSRLCDINTCHVSPPQNGRASRQVSCNYKEQIHYSCNRGYTMEGSPYAKCQANSTFDNPLPTCNPNKCNVPSIKNGRHTPNTLQVDYQTQVTFTCNSGYRPTRSHNSVTCLEDNNFDGEIPTCQDIDECLNASTCGDNMKCTNLNGSHGCDCVSGFTEHFNGGVKVCENIDECAEKTHKCALKAICKDTIGGNECHCPDGHHLEINSVKGDKCVRQPCVNYLSSARIKPYSLVFEDTIRASCFHGYALTGSRTGTCNGDRGLDWDGEEPECTRIRCNITAPENGTATASADSDSDFSVGPGQTVHYECLQGFRLIGDDTATCQGSGQLNPATPSCQAIKECFEGGHYCHTHAICNNTETSKGCTCKPGFTGDGKDCEDIKECAAVDPPACHSNATCTEMIGKAPVCTCKDGFKGDGIISCESQDCPNTPIERGTVSPSSDVIEHGKDVRYSCERGFYIDGLERQKCLYGNFSSRLPRCKAIQCPVIAKIDNGYADSSIHGKLIFHCNRGFILRGNRVLNCTPEGDLDGGRPFCQDIDECRANATDGYDVHTCAEEATCINTKGSHNCSCKSGFEGDGHTCEDINECVRGTHNCHRLASCQNTRGSHNCHCGTGAHGDGTHCYPISCKVPTIYFGRCDTDQSEFGYNETIQCHCIPGFEFNSYEKGIIQCFGEIVKAPICSRTLCQGPFYLMNGEVMQPLWKRPSGIAVYEETLHYQCHRGYTLEGKGNRTCLENNNFSSPAPRCNAVRCQVSAPKFGKATPAGEVPIDTNVSYTCNKGYGLHGSPRAQCLVNGTWSLPAPHCRDLNECSQEESHNCHKYAHCININGSYECFCWKGFEGNGTYCQDIDECHDNTHNCHAAAHCINTIGSFECDCLTGYKGNGTHCDLTYCQSPSGAHLERRPSSRRVSYNTTVQYRCKRGYNLTGPQRRTCLDEQMTGDLPRCDPVICTSPQLENGNVSSSAVAFNHSVRYECNEGYYIVGLSERRCRVTKKNKGLLRGEMPVCEECFWEQRTAKGYVSISQDGRVTCSHRYFPSNSSRAKCVNGTWQTHTRCLPCRLKVPEEESSGSGEATETKESSGELSVFENGTATCAYGHTYVGPNPLDCEDGNYVNVGNCTINKCSIQAPSNGDVNVTSDTINYKESVKYSCDFGYTLVGSEVAMCKADHTMSAPVPECQINKCRTSKPENGYIIPNSETIDYGRNVAYECNAGYRLFGDNYHRCTGDKELNGTKPGCQDVNECNGSHPCDQHAICKNTVGNFSCTCEPGWTGNGTYCSNINECESPVCPINSTCHDTPGSFYCTCNRGFRLNNETGECDVIVCPVPTFPGNGNFVHPPTTVRHSHSIPWKCDYGYHVDGEVSGECICLDSGMLGPLTNCTPCTGTKYGGEGSEVDPVTGVVGCMNGYFKHDHEAARCINGVWETVDVCTACTWKDAGKKGYESIEPTTGMVTCSPHYEAIPRNPAQPYGSCPNKTWVRTAMCLHNTSCPQSKQSRYMLVPGLPNWNYQDGRYACGTINGRMPRLQDASCVKKYISEILDPLINRAWIDGHPFTYPNASLIESEGSDDFPPFVCELLCFWRDKGLNGYMNISDDGDVTCLPGYTRIESDREPVCEKGMWRNTAECKHCTWSDQGKPGYAGIDLNGEVTCSENYITEYPDGDPFCNGTGWHNTAKCLVACSWDYDQQAPDNAILHSNGTVTCQWEGTKSKAVVSGGPVYCDPVSRKYQLNHTECVPTQCRHWDSDRVSVGVGTYLYQNGTIGCILPHRRNHSIKSKCTFNGWIMEPGACVFSFTQSGGH